MLCRTFAQRSRIRLPQMLPIALLRWYIAQKSFLFSWTPHPFRRSIIPKLKPSQNHNLSIFMRSQVHHGPRRTRKSRLRTSSHSRRSLLHLASFPSMTSFERSPSCLDPSCKWYWSDHTKLYRSTRSSPLHSRTVSSFVFVTFRNIWTIQRTTGTILS